MNTNFPVSIITGFLILLFQYISAQEPSDESTSKSSIEFDQVGTHFIYSEIGGRTIKFGSLRQLGFLCILERCFFFCRLL